VSAFIGDDLMQLLTEQSKLYVSEYAGKWKVSSKTLKRSDITPEEMRKFWGINNFDGTSQKGKYRRL